MKIKIKRIIDDRYYLKIDEPKMGSLQVDGLPTAIECAEVIGVGENTKFGIKKGDRIMYKAWAVDICTVDGERFYYLSESTGGICSVIE